MHKTAPQNAAAYNINKLLDYYAYGLFISCGYDVTVLM